MSFCKSVLLSFGIILNVCAYAQSTSVQKEDTTAVTPQSISSKFLDNTSSKASRVAKKLDKKTTKALLDLQNQEIRIQRKLARKDSLKAASVFGNAKQQYTQLQQKLQKQGSLQEYIPGLDSMSSTLKFLQQNPLLLSKAKGGSQKLENAITQVNRMEGQFQNAEEVKRFQKERRQYLKEQLQNFGFAKELKNLNKQAYYYSEQINKFKAVLKDHKKAEREVITLLSKTKLFQNFMRKNSILASLFRMPGDPSDPVNPASLAGLQTRVQISNLIQQQIGTTGQSQFQQNMQDAQSQLQQLKDKIIKSGNNSSDAEMPEGFKPNDQKTKSFLKRLEYGTNIQSQKASNFFPVTSDIGLSLGYRLNDKSIIGIGTSYKIGWGNGWKNIDITNQGVGLRTFIDWKIKGSFWLSGGYEQNYKTAFDNIDELKDQNAWQQSGLIGLSKVVSLKTKFFRKTQLQLLWDFLSYQQVPRTQPVLFRVGYKF